MPILWRYLLSSYLKVFVLCVGAFIAILLTMRLDEIAYFATLGPEAWHIVWFALQQIPYVLPIALPTSALISAVLLVQSLSQSRELTAMRACGYALRDILTPVLLTALFLSMLNFYVVSELSTKSHLNAGLLKNQLRSINPLLLLHNKHVMKMKGFYFDTLGASRVGEFAHNVVFFAPNKHHNRLNLMVAKQLQANPLAFVGQDVTWLTSQAAEREGFFEPVILENIQNASMTIQNFSQFLEKKIWTINNDHLNLPLLLIRLQETKAHLKDLFHSNASKIECKEGRYALNRCLTEVLRRLSVGFSVFSFTFMGLAFGINISRSHTSRGIFCVIALAAFYLFAFFVAKSFDHVLLAAALLYLLPHALICVASLWMLHRIAQGIE